MSKSRNQRTDVLQYMREHNGITQLEAYREFPAPITRLGSVIFDLRKHYNIVSVPIEGENCYGHYSCVRYILRE